MLRRMKIRMANSLFVFESLMMPRMAAVDVKSFTRDLLFASGRG
jgi:hypothetical protein